MTTQKKLAFIILFPCISSLLATGLYYVISSWYDIRKEMVQEVSVLSQVVANRSTAALVFDDPDLARENLAALAAHKSIEEACIRRGNTWYAAYAQTVVLSDCQGIEGEPEFPATGHLFKGNYLLFTQPVMLNEELLGSLFIRANLKAFNKRLQQHVLTTLFVIVLTGAAAFFFSYRLQRKIFAPIRKLAKAAVLVTESKDYSIRAEPPQGDDEICNLVRTFNGMLDQIEASSAKLLESEVRFRTIFNAANDAFFIHDTETGAILDVNLKMCEMFGLSREEALRSNFGAMSSGVPPYTQEYAVKWLGKAAAGEPQLFEWQAKDKKGRLFWVEISMKRAEIGPSELIIVSARDITERRRAQEDLQRNEQILRLFVEHSPAAIAMFDNDMKYIVASRRFLLDYDLGDQNIIGRSHYEVFPEMTERLRAIHRRCLAGAVEKSEGEPFQRLNEKTEWVRWELRPWFEKQGDIGGVIFFSEVITERMKNAEEIRRVNEELLAVNRIISACTSSMESKEILDKIMDEALAITDLEGGTICFVTKEETLHIIAHRETSEATIEDLTTHAVKVGDCLCGVCARDHKPLILSDREAVLKFATREATRGEDIRFHAAFPLVTGERCLGVLCVFTRTNSKPTERSLKILETVSSQIAMAIDNAQLYEESLQLAANLEERVQDRTSELEKARHALLNLVEDLNNANEKLKELDRLKSMFIASMSHELRTPLNSIIGFSSILHDEWIGPLNEEQKHNQAIILRSGKHLLSLINDIIDISKIEAGKIETTVDTFELNEVVEEAAEGFKDDLKSKGLAFNMELSGMTLKTDRRRVLQCLINLLSNAIKFTDSGSIWVSTTKQEERGTVAIEVRDTGLGIAPEDTDRLFKPFGRLHAHGDATYPGTGLGLHLTHKLVTEILGGEITMTSKPGEGSTFTITIPLEVET